MGSEIAVVPAGPAITHSSDFSLVTASKPATAGEILSLFARGLGPVTPGVDPGQPFPSNPLAIVNSPVASTYPISSPSIRAATSFPRSPTSPAGPTHDGQPASHPHAASSSAVCFSSRGARR